MKKTLLSSVFALAAVAYGGLWDTLNKVQRTVDTVKAVGEAIEGRPAPVQQPVAIQAAQSARIQPAVAQPAVAPAPAAVAAAQVSAAVDPAALKVYKDKKTTGL